jgi:hypothetical protein
MNGLFLRKRILYDYENQYSRKALACAGKRQKNIFRFSKFFEIMTLAPEKMLFRVWAMRSLLYINQRKCNFC